MKWAAVVALGWTLAMLLKGPVGIPMMLGLLIGGSIATRRWGWLRLRIIVAMLVAILVGVVVFMLWLWGVKLGMADRIMPMQGDGAGELMQRLTPSAGKIGYALAFPLIMVAYGFPFSLAALWIWTPCGRGLRRCRAKRIRKVKRRIRGGRGNG